MEATMDDPADTTVPTALTDALDASMRDLAAGNLIDARDVQAEARQMLIEYERAHPPSERRSRFGKRATPA
jgi:hypothetical protein